MAACPTIKELAHTETNNEPGQQTTDLPNVTETLHPLSNALFLATHVNMRCKHCWSAPRSAYTGNLDANLTPAQLVQRFTNSAAQNEL